MESRHQATNTKLANLDIKGSLRLPPGQNGEHNNRNGVTRSGANRESDLIDIGDNTAIENEADILSLAWVLSSSASHLGYATLETSSTSVNNVKIQADQ